MVGISTHCSPNHSYDNNSYHTVYLMDSWEGFVERVLYQLQQLRTQKADILILLGRHSKETGDPLPPKIQIKIQEEGRTILYDG